MRAHNFGLTVAGFAKRFAHREKRMNEDRNFFN